MGRHSLQSLALVLSGFLAAPAHLQGRETGTQIEGTWEIGKVPAGFPVGFCLLTSGQKQYVAYYDEQRRMTIAARTLDADNWTYHILPSNIEWDSHNYITMAVDDDGHLHVSGNMHAVPLIYFRTEKAGDITTLTKLSMTGDNEKRVTYPKFMRDAENRLVFHYRDGGSGRGNEIYNVYDPKAREWSRLLDKPLADGEGERNAYMAGPAKGPDGWFHMNWVWRDTSDCATNHHLSYARSRDLLRWESAFGDKIELPIRLDQKALWVDPIPAGGGIINGGHRLFFDENNKPILAYHKSDGNGHMQIYAARPRGSRWDIRQLTDWNKPVKFSGGGSMPFIGISIGNLQRAEEGFLTLNYRHKDYGSGLLVIDEKTLRPVDKKVSGSPGYPKEVNELRSDFPGMSVRHATDSGDSGDKDVSYLLKWETLESHHDRPREPPLPEPSTLILYKLKHLRVK